MITDEKTYEQRLLEMQMKYEGLCRRCGACCGVYENDPCVELVRDPDGTYHCSDYDNRFGLHKTVHGNEFKCVPFRRIVGGSWSGSWRCGYKKVD
jgi:hypothetical protein